MSLLDDEVPIDVMIIEVKKDTYDWDVIGKVFKRSGGSNMGLDGYGPPSYNEEYDMLTYSFNNIGSTISVY